MAIKPLLGAAYDESPFGYADRMGFLEPARPVSEDRLRRRAARTRQTPSEFRAEMRRYIVANIRLLADPENAWNRDQFELNRARSLNRYRLALSSLRGEVRPELPGGIIINEFRTAA